MLAISVKSPYNVGRQRQLAPRAGFRGRNRERLKPPVNVINAEPGHLNRTQTQVDETERDSVVAPALARPAVEGREELPPLAFIQDPGRPLVTKIRYRWHRKHQCRRALASQVHKTQKLPQNRESAIDALGTQNATPEFGIAT